VFGVFCRRWGIPLMDGGTIRLARMIGHSHALDMILTGRGVSGDEALRFGLANRLVSKGQALAAALDLARQLAMLPQGAMRSDRLSSYEQWALDLPAALANEYRHGRGALATGQSAEGLARYAAGAGRHGEAS
jgi:enoyl-CoA hydratase